MLKLKQFATLFERDGREKICEYLKSKKWVMQKIIVIDLNMYQPDVSEALKELVLFNLVDAQKLGRAIYYKLNREHYDNYRKAIEDKDSYKKLLS